jgi:hypothetical protein
MINKSLIIVITLFLFGCKDSSDNKVVNRTFTVFDFCLEDIESYFGQQKVINLGVDFNILKVNSKLMGAEHIVGTAIVNAKGLDIGDVNSIINGALRHCYPNAQIKLSLDSVAVENILRQANMPEAFSKNHIFKIEGNNLVVSIKK